MSEDRERDTTLVGHVASVRGGLVLVRLADTPTTLAMVEGESYRVGQLGAFLRIPLGYTQLYGVCTQVGADIAPGQSADVDYVALEAEATPSMVGYRWMTIAL